MWVTIRLRWFSFLWLLWCPHTAFSSSYLVKCTLRWFESQGRCWKSASFTSVGTNHWFWFERKEPLPPWDNLVRPVNGRAYHAFATYFFLASFSAAGSYAASTLPCVSSTNQKLTCALWMEQKVRSRRVGFKRQQPWSAHGELIWSPDCLIWWNQWQEFV